jgi:hypothetical protein
VSLFSFSSLTLAEYIKVSNSGKALPVSAVLGGGENDWACTYDSATKLMWEIKTTDGGLRDQRWMYTWYNSNSPDGNKGSVSGGNCKTGGRCDTEKFTQDVNTQGLCGSKDWRMPNRDELKTLVYCSTGMSLVGSSNAIDISCAKGSQQPTLYSGYFPNTRLALFWSSSLNANSSQGALLVGFSTGHANYWSGKEGSNFVRLVRSQQPIDGQSGFSAPAGTAVGDMQYWDGSRWAIVPAGINGAYLVFCNGKPVWGSCNAAPSPAPSTGYKIGDTGPMGGKVFYVDASLVHGLEAQPADYNNRQKLAWADAIIAGTSYGAGWHLPTKDELYQLYNYRSIVGGFSGEFYWSSTEHDDSTAWLQYGNNAQMTGSKYGMNVVRAVRAF